MVTRRFVAALDVLGFKRRIAAEGVQRVFADYGQLKTAASVNAKVTIAGTLFGQLVGAVVDIPFVLLSDTVLLWCDELGDVDAFLTACGALVAESVRMRMPLRGAIAFGETIIDPGSLTFLGQPLVDVHVAEEAQEWVGVAVHPSAAGMLSKRDGIVPYDVPVKTRAWRFRGLLPGSLRRCVPAGLLKSHLKHALCWHHHLLATEAFSRLREMGDAADRKNRNKYWNAADFVRAMPIE